MQKRVAILGSTGSVGTQALDVLDSNSERFQVVALTANDNVQKLAEQIERFNPKWFDCNPDKAATEIGEARRLSAREIVGSDDVDTVLFASAGYDALSLVLAAAEAGKTIALANKEALVMGGQLIMETVAKHSARLLPVDSELSAVYQCLLGENSAPARVVLTASGGALRDFTAEEVAAATLEDVLRHPNWQMGAKITVDSATLINKAFEVAEVHWLFGVPFDRIETVVHPQSVVHSLVVFRDGSSKAQLSPPDMRYAIQYALEHGERTANSKLNADWHLSDVPQLSFEPLREGAHHCFGLALDYIKRGDTWPAAFVGASFAATTLFIERQISFPGIRDVIEYAMAQHKPVARPSEEEIADAAKQMDRIGRRFIR